ncbi:MAG: molybdenum cofactor guanylyltransferase [Bacteroidales bacterium]|nr:molybdenum cofactor guanylyltransferase [Bacteroidales bacterium]
MMHLPKYTAVILAGGRARRFGGRHKPLAVLRGQTLLEHQLEVLEPLFGEILLITNDPQAFHSYSHLRIQTDVMADKGPLGGIHSALHHASQQSLFVVAGDMPFLRDRMIRQQINISVEQPGQAIVPKTGEKTEPLHAIYPKATLQTLEPYLKQAADRSVRSFLEHIPVYYWNVSDAASFVSINTPEELRHHEAG